MPHRASIWEDSFNCTHTVMLSQLRSIWYFSEVDSSGLTNRRFLYQYLLQTFPHFSKLKPQQKNIVSNLKPQQAGCLEKNKTLIWKRFLHTHQKEKRKKKKKKDKKFLSTQITLKLPSTCLKLLWYPLCPTGLYHKTPKL